MKLLLIEDEKTILHALEKGFRNLGYIVDIARDGEEALDQYFSNSYNLIVLDLNLPKLDGIEILKIIRDDDRDIKIIILSARDSIEDKITGLDLGANDYMDKPFSFMELEARVRALLRRDFSVSELVIDYRGLEVDTKLKKVFYMNEEIILTNKEYGILEYLFLKRGEKITGEELIEFVWDDNVDELTNSFKVHISNLRSKLPIDIIKNTRGQGYYVE